MTTREEPCPKCGGPAVDRGEYWETAWTPEPVTLDESRRIAHDRANRLARENKKLRQAILWALGENGEFAPEPEGDRRRYWWRSGLRSRAFDKAK